MVICNKLKTIFIVIDKKLDLLVNKLHPIYSKIYKNDNMFFFSQKFLKHSIIISFLTINSNLFILGEFNFIMFILLNTFFVLILSLFLLIGFIYNFNGVKKASKLTDEEWDYYKELNCYHLTSRNNLNSIKNGSNIHLKPTIYWLANLQVYFKKSVYFFSSIPNENDIKNQLLINKKDLMIIVPMRNLDRNKLRIRRNMNNTLVYTSEYKGIGEIIEFK